MVLGYGGFLGLSGGNEYRHKFRQATKDFLKKHVFAKNRGQVTCALSVTSGFVFAVATSHGSLIMSGIARRKRRVDDRKTEMIQELKRRSIVLHKMDWMDVCMPNGTFALGVGIVEEGAEDHAGLTTPSSSDDVQEIVSRPSTATEFIDAMSVPTDEWVSRGALSVAQLLGIQGPVPEIDAFGTKIADDDSAVDLAETFGNIAAQQLSWWITEPFENPDWNRRASQSLGCSRYLGSTSRTCDCCRKSINSGSYMRECNLTSSY
ncbi:hypothetical protein DBV05_g10332 [Lasiodiplodia theobromae]|uniref:Uncharacterized protein n=1 Tax=Lasiodiplodia theobromae TaxID=45133 RepID=A0A5N5D095_9PEZI|nr:hypothetical protein DBV05_g10332 [Lasiodiplodia theobromae]